MPPSPCQNCQTNRALILRPKNHHKLCKSCFFDAFESEIHNTIISHSLFRPGERVAIGASGGKDSTVLASVLKTLNERHNYKLDLCLLSIDEGITGYRDDSLETVKRNAEQYGLSLEILGYKELYGWTMDEVVSQVGKKGNCTYCGVFRRQALDRGAAKLGVEHVVTGHNADDIAETVMMNLLRGDLPRLSRATSIMTSSPSSPIKRSKPLKYAYEKEIVLYAHHKKLDYFSTECIYSPEAFRGSARALIKNLERIRPSAILDVVRSGEDMARSVPAEITGTTTATTTNGQQSVQRKYKYTAEENEDEGGCGTAQDRSSGGEMAVMERRLQRSEQDDDNITSTAIEQPNGNEIEITRASIAAQRHDRNNSSSKSTGSGNSSAQNQKQFQSQSPIDQDRTNSDQYHNLKSIDGLGGSNARQWAATLPSRSNKERKGTTRMPKKAPTPQRLGQCERCGYLSSQAVCKACTLLEGLNRNRPKTEIAL